MSLETLMVETGAFEVADTETGYASTTQPQRLAPPVVDQEDLSVQQVSALAVLQLQEGQGVEANPSELAQLETYQPDGNRQAPQPAAAADHDSGHQGEHTRRVSFSRLKRKLSHRSHSAPARLEETEVMEEAVATGEVGNGTMEGGGIDQPNQETGCWHRFAEKLHLTRTRNAGIDG